MGIPCSIIHRSFSSSSSSSCNRVCTSSSSQAGKLDMVLCLDINGTIIEGDSLHNMEVSGLTQPSLNLLTEWKNSCGSRRLLLYTFGKDYVHAVDAIRKHGVETPPANNYFFIARASASDDIYAFPMTTEDSSPYVVVPGQKNPRLETAPPGRPNLLELEEWQPTDRDCDDKLAHRFRSTAAFQTFVDSRLQAGAVVFRACFDPANPDFLGRKNEDKKACKVIACSKPALIFDDNPGDWEVLGANGGSVENETQGGPQIIGRIVPTVSPTNAKTRGGVVTDMLAEFCKYEQFLLAQPQR